jgi:hypothetical protein
MCFIGASGYISLLTERKIQESLVAITSCSSGAKNGCPNALYSEDYRLLRHFRQAVTESIDNEFQPV